MTDPLALPLKLTPRFDPKPWGGRRLERFGFILPGAGPIGEAVITAGDARVAGGDLDGISLQALVDRDPERVIGARGLAATGGNALFPLLIKLIDASEDLSIQVHPGNDAAAAEIRLGKTETYHVLASAAGSTIALGLLPEISATDFAAACRTGMGVSERLRWIPARTGESILIPAGTVHALGAGCLVFEAQQPSEITYRLHDWDRLGIDGGPRPLHLDDGLAVYDPASRPGPIAPLGLRSASGRRHLLTACRYFAVERIALARGEEMSTTATGSPHTLTVLRGAVEAGSDVGQVAVAGGETAIAAAACPVRLRATAPAVLLRTWVPDLLTEIVIPALAAGHEPAAVSALAGSLPDITTVLQDRPRGGG
ncbi:MAG: class I mannose-6-phosphate isomerase [Chloroflexota bacterium]|nr:class I mannose-6-phosphate isomerase [Chloroflexota bacterium]